MPSFKLYCSSCGAANSYTNQKPNFCQKCGASLGVSKASTKSAPSKSLELEETEESFSIPPISELQVDSTIYKPSAEKLENLVGSSQGELGSDSLRRPSNTYGQKGASQKEIMAEFQKEAGAIKPNG